MAVFEGANSNFDSSVSGQTNEIWMPEVYSKNVQMFFRKASVIEDITSNEYMGEIASFGDTVQIVKEPTIQTYDYTRGADVTQNMLNDQELTLVVDQARAFKFIVDD